MNSPGRAEPPRISPLEASSAAASLAALAIFYLWTLGKPSLWLDEAWEANYYAGYAAAPWYNRPVLYMAAVTALVRLAGPSEFVLRLIPCLAGVGAIAATWRFSRVRLGRAEAWLAASLLAVAPPLLEFAHQLKHYTLDALAAVLLAGAYLRWSEERSTRRLAVVAALAVVSSVVSFTSPFVIGGAALAAAWAARADRAALARLGAVHVAIVVLFGASYLAWYRAGATDPQLLDYFVEAYAPWHAPGALPGWLARETVNLLGNQIGFGSGVAVLLLASAGAVAAWPGRASGIAVTLVAGLAMNAAASGGRLYPYGVTRLSLFVAPLLAMIVAAGVGALVSPGRARAARTLAVVALLYPALYPSILAARPYLTTGWRREHVRELVTALDREREAGDGILVNEDAEPAFRFYWSRLGRGSDLEEVEWAPRFRQEPARHAPGVAEIAARYRRLWGLFTHLAPEEMQTLRELIQERCAVETSMVEGDARLERYRCPGP